jgi:RNA polymerase sigma factor (sigma-70 family)
MDRSEIDAIRQILAGDSDEYRVLIDRYFQSVFRIAFRITGDETDAEEATQEAFLRAYNKLSTFRQDASFSTWITRIAMNTSINLVERRSRDLPMIRRGSGMLIRQLRARCRLRMGRRVRSGCCSMRRRRRCARQRWRR